MKQITINCDKLHFVNENGVPAKTWRVEYITQAEAGDFFNYEYNGQWADELVTADTPEEAVELVKDYIKDAADGEDIENDYLFRAIEVSRI